MNFFRFFKVRPARSTASFVLVTVLFTVVTVTGCGNKTRVSQAAPPPPPPPAPTTSIEVNPAMVQPGGSATINWKTENATEVRIEPLGKVDANGSKTVNPTDSTDYRLIATGPGGTQETVARITVAATGTSLPVRSDDFFAEQNERQDVFFDLDQYTIRSDQRSTILNDAKFLNQHPDLYVMIEGHCDELGSTNYNLALGDIRANEVKEALVKAGVDAARIDTVTYGKERPFCHEPNESCWKQNRRAHIVSVQR